MDLTEKSLAGKLASDLVKEARKKHERLGDLPVSAEDYTALAEEERAEVAREIFSHYANMPTYDATQYPSKGLPAYIPTETEGVILEGRVGYTELNWLPREARKPQLVMWLQATEPMSGVRTGFKKLRGVELPTEEYGWRYEVGRSDHPEAMEIIDAAVCQMLDGRIADERAALGSSALLGALAAPVH